MADSHEYSFYNSTICSIPGSFTDYVSHKPPIIPSTSRKSLDMRGVSCYSTLLDPGNLSFNVLNLPMAKLLQAQGIPLKKMKNSLPLLAFNGVPSSAVYSIYIPFLTFHFPSGSCMEENVRFVVFDSPVDSKPEMIISHRFLCIRFGYNLLTALNEFLIPRLDNSSLYLGSRPREEICSMSSLLEEQQVATEVNYLTWISSMTSTPEHTFIPCNIHDELYQLRQILTTVEHDSLGFPLKIANVKRDVDFCSYLIHSSTLPSPLDKFPMEVAIPTTTRPIFSISNSKLLHTEWSRVKSSFINLFSSDVHEEVTLTLGSDQLNALTHAGVRYTLTRHVDLSNTACATESPSLVPPQSAAVNPGSSRVAELPVDRMEATPVQSWDEASCCSPSLANDSAGHIKAQCDGMRRRILLIRLRAYAKAARHNLPRDDVYHEYINSLSNGGKDYTYLVRENETNFQVQTDVFVAEQDPVIAKNEQAFWFGKPQSKEEVQSFVNERLNHARDNLPKELVSEEQFDQLRKLVEANTSLLRTRLGNDKVAKFDPLDVTLKPNVIPKKRRNYPLSAEAKDQMLTQIDELKAAGLIQKVTKPVHWCSTAHMVKKPGGSPGEMRMVVDYSYVNSCTIPIQGGLPILEEDLKVVAGAKFFLSADFLKGYFQAKLNESSQELFSFLAADGSIYQPTRVPQGAADSPIFFHNQLANAFADLIRDKKMLLWIDDVLLFAHTWEEFISLVKRFFELCEQYDLQVSVKKTTLADVKATFCGRDVSGTGIKLQARNTSTFINMQEPQTAGDLSQFLMGLQWMECSILNTSAEDSFRAISAPLWDILELAYTKAGARKKARYKNIKLTSLGWTVVHSQAFARLKHKLAHECIEQAFAIPGARKCLFTDASDKHYAALLTQVVDWDEKLPVQSQKHIPMATLSGTFKRSELNWRIIEKEAYPLIKAVQQWDYTLSTSDGFNCYVDHRNLVHLFHPEVNDPPLSKNAKNRVYNWLYLLSNYRIRTLEHLPGENNLWADMLSRWANPEYSTTVSTPGVRPTINAFTTAQSPAAALRSVPMDDEDHTDDDELVGIVTPVEPDSDEDTPSTPPANPNQRKKRNKKRVRKRKKVQYARETIISNTLKFLYDPGTPQSERISWDLIKTAQETLNREEANWLHTNMTCNPPRVRKRPTDNLLVYVKDREAAADLSKCPAWIPHRHEELLTRLLVTAHVGSHPGVCDVGHRGAPVTYNYLQEYVWFENMNDFVKGFVQTCITCLKLKGTNERVPRPLGTQIEATNRGEILCVDYLYIGEPRKKSSHNCRYILVLKDKFSRYVELIPTESCTTDEVAKAITWWCVRYTTPTYLMSDNGSHFTSQLIAELARSLVMQHHFTLPYCPWSNGSVERVNREIQSLLRIMQSSHNIPHYEWPTCLPNVQDVLNKTPSSVLGNRSPKEIFQGFPRFNPLQYMLREEEDTLALDDFVMDVNVERSFKALQEALHTSGQRVTAESRLRAGHNAAYLAKQLPLRVRRAQELGKHIYDVTNDELLPRFVPGDFVLVATTMKHRHKLQAIWQGPCRIVELISPYAYKVAHLVSGAEKIVHISRLRFYCDALVDLPLPLLDQLTKEQHFDFIYNVERLLDLRYNESSKLFEILVQWEGLSELEQSWEPATELIKQIPDLVKDYLRGLPDTNRFKVRALKALKVEEEL
jgi:hypothetical protein